MSIWVKTKPGLKIYYLNNRVVMAIKEDYLKTFGKLQLVFLNRDLVAREEYIKNHLLIQQEVSTPMAKVIYGK